MLEHTALWTRFSDDLYIVLLRWRVLVGTKTEEESDYHRHIAGN